ncbi:hypothetical protein BDV23DRAFT_182431 [Aspergillus alliaceus]|uniref:F-box domain-containing protein n=1 Tax=Petromyces alliaceus TaxID=209559 RepID=A0A5N7CCH5_PETAA|nr:hypothetical protein BDV23DRAFT_182431 [Aspergillus alliaceus]
MVYLSSELVLEILKYAEPNIAPFLRINSQWFFCGISLVWRHVWSGVLHRVPKNRRQIYTSEIRGFRIYPEATKYLGELSHLPWPKLEMLYIDFGYDDKPGQSVALTDNPYLKCYMHRGLTGIHLQGAFDPELLRLSQVSCPRIQRFSISTSGTRITPEVFLEYLQESPSLTDISINSEELVTREILNHLAGRDGLQHLYLEGIIDIDAIKALNISSPFKTLQHLTVSATEAALPLLVGVIGSVRSVHLTLDGPRDPLRDVTFDSVALKHISNLVELRVLNLFVWGNMRIRNEDMVSLKSLTQLRRLSISGACATSLIAPRLQDADFEELFRNLGQLESLNFDVFRSDITTDSLKSLGRCCPSLQRCEIMGIYDMAAFRYEKAPLFPTLVLLSIGAFTNLERMMSSRRPYEHVRQIEKHFPNLQELDCTFRTFPIVQDEFPEKVLRTWWKRQVARKTKP